MKENKNILDNEYFKQNPFSVPEEYFEDNFISLYSKILSAPSEPLSTPEDYFNTNKIKLYQSILSDNKNNSDFVVPENYFDAGRENLYQKIISQTRSQKSKSKTIIYLFRYIAAAAVVTGIIWGIDWMYKSQNNKVIPNNDCKTIACLTKKEILSKENILDDELLEETISDEMIEKNFQLPDNNKTFIDSNQSNKLNETF